MGIWLFFSPTDHAHAEEVTSQVSPAPSETSILGMFIAWVVLDGSAKVVVGYGIIMTTIIWILTSPIRHRGED